MKKNSYFYGKPVTIETDHPPFVIVLKPPFMLHLQRLQRKMLRLQKYYGIILVYKNGKHLYVINTLSSPTKMFTDRKVVNFKVMTDNYLSSSNFEELKRHTANDAALQTLSTIIKYEWPAKQHCLPRFICVFLLENN